MKRIGVLTSGGDAPGMNAAVRAVVRTALDKNADIFAIYEGYQGMVDGGEYIRRMSWGDVGGILHQGGTIIGSARCAAFREREGRRRAALNLVKNKIDALVIIGGDGSLTGAHVLQKEWRSLLGELVDSAEISQEDYDTYVNLAIVGMVGSIDNDMHGTDMTIGADTALHRIVDAIDSISSTAASHQRTFVVEVMGRHCGYLALMAALASGADWVLIPENPPDLDDWESKMCEVLQRGREVGRRDSIVIVAEGAIDRDGKPITSQSVKEVLETRLGEDTRVTVLGHVQRGGAPSAFDRNLSTLCGADAIEAILAGQGIEEPLVVGIQGNRITRTPLSVCLERTWAVAEAIRDQEYELAMDRRGSSFKEAFHIVRTVVRTFPHDPTPGQRRMRIGVVHAGGPAPGMNTAVRAAVRLGIDQGHEMIGIQNGFKGLIRNDVVDLDWNDVGGWALRGGAELGTNRYVPESKDLYAIARTLEEHRIEGLLMVGGWTGYEAVLKLLEQRSNYPAFDIPIVCLPATINNNLPGTQLSVGADTALNSIVDTVDKIKQSAVASRRTFIIEVMGNYCGYLALLGAMATGAERVYLHEEGVSIHDMVTDVDHFIDAFQHGKRLGLVIRSEHSHPIYTAEFMAALFEAEGGDLFDVRTSVLGHMQQGGNPTPFDRIFSTRLASRCVDYLIKQIEGDDYVSACIGLEGSMIRFTDMRDVGRIMDLKTARPKKQWWMDLRPIVRIMAQQAPGVYTNNNKPSPNGRDAATASRVKTVVR